MENVYSNRNADEFDLEFLDFPGERREEEDDLWALEHALEQAEEDNFSSSDVKTRFITALWNHCVEQRRFPNEHDFVRIGSTVGIQGPYSTVRSRFLSYAKSARQRARDRVILDTEGPTSVPGSKRYISSLRNPEILRLDNLLKSILAVRTSGGILPGDRPSSILSCINNQRSVFRFIRAGKRQRAFTEDTDMDRRQAARRLPDVGPRGQASALKNQLRQLVFWEIVAVYLLRCLHVALSALVALAYAAFWMLRLQALVAEAGCVHGVAYPHLSPSIDPAHTPPLQD